MEVQLQKLNFITAKDKKTKFNYYKDERNKSKIVAGIKGKLKN